MFTIVGRLNCLPHRERNICCDFTSYTRCCVNASSFINFSDNRLPTRLILPIFAYFCLKLTIFRAIMIAVHCGAGHYSDSKQKDYALLSKKACRKAMAVLNNSGSALDVVREAIRVLEDDPLTNAGFGSNLTLDGTVEGDASVMNGENLIFGACGAVRKIKNPICLAYDIYQKQLEPTPLGLVPPNVLVGDGAYNHAKKAGLKVVSDSKLISRKALKQREKYKAMLDGVSLAQQKISQNHIDEVEIEFSESLDTVGAVCIDDAGNVASGCSSGGLLLKRPGRMGQAAQYGSGVWADSMDKTSRPSIAVCTTGCGEHLVQTLLAKTIAEDLLVEKNCPTVDLHHCLIEKFMNSRHLRQIKTAKLGGALVLKADNTSGEVSLMWGHSTWCLGVGYMKKGDRRPHSQISMLPGNAEEGKSVNVGGTAFYFKKLRSNVG